MLTAIIPKDKERICKLIKALEWQLEHDANEKDKGIHQQALKELRGSL